MNNIDNPKGKQEIIKFLYENFIKTAFPKEAEKLGVAYTPIEVVDFILHSANTLLKQEFNRALTDEGVHILEPFLGTGAFLNRLISSDELIKEKDLPRKFKSELYGNEILLLPYYIASINIEAAYNSRIKDEYTPFPGITFADTFNIIKEQKGQQPFSFMENPFKENKDRIKRQLDAPIQVIISNPPYFGGQKSENDGNKNTRHDCLNRRVEETYVKESTSTNKNSLYDSYIKAIRWLQIDLETKKALLALSITHHCFIGLLAQGLENAL